MKLRPNIMLIVGGVFLLCAGILFMLYYALGQEGDGNDFVIGALIGLIGTGLTALTSLGNNILEKDKDQ